MRPKPWTRRGRKAKTADGDDVDFGDALGGAPALASSSGQRTQPPTSAAASSSGSNGSSTRRHVLAIEDKPRNWNDDVEEVFDIMPEASDYEAGDDFPTIAACALLLVIVQRACMRSNFSELLL